MKRFHYLALWIGLALVLVVSGCSDGKASSPAVSNTNGLGGGDNQTAAQTVTGPVRGRYDFQWVELDPVSNNLEDSAVAAGSRVRQSIQLTAYAQQIPVENVAGLDSTNSQTRIPLSQIQNLRWQIGESVQTQYTESSRPAPSLLDWWPDATWGYCFRPNSLSQKMVYTLQGEITVNGTAYLVEGTFLTKNKPPT